MDLKQYDALLHDVETRLDRLRALYEQYFQGLERTEPAIQRRDFDALLKVLRKEQPLNTALRFRFQQLVQRNVTLDTHWRKTIRQIEDGTYRRDVLRARKRRDGRAGGDEPAMTVHEIDMSMDVDGALDSMFPDDAEISISTVRDPVAPLPPPSPSSPPPAPRALSPFAKSSLRRSQPPPGAVPVVAPPARPSSRPAPSKSFARPMQDVIPSAPRMPTGIHAPTAPRPAAPAPPRPAAPAAPRPTAPTATAGGPTSYSEHQLKQLYERYVTARKGNNERVDNVKLESLQKTVEGMLPKLREKHGGKQIDFDVVVRNGKVALKPVAK